MSETRSCFAFVLIGASGDLAKKITFPTLFALFQKNLLPQNSIILGYARSPLSRQDFLARVNANIKADQKDIDRFNSICQYLSGKYESAEDMAALDKHLCDIESNYEEANRIFYLAIPPNIFVDASRSVHSSAIAKKGWTRVIVEKPFGRDLQTSQELLNALSELFQESQMYRIDHYLGKAMVQNLMALRFANRVFEPLWSSQHISNVQIVFKEDIGVTGRGGYFDNYGIIRDIMQNHLLQILTLVAMEPPVDSSDDSIRDEKVKVLKAIEPLKVSDIVVGQFTAGKGQKGYLEEDDVPKDSVTPTFACAHIHIRNQRWEGVPFILRCGKGLDARKTEVRIQFKKVPGRFCDSFNTAQNELVIRVQPQEALYLKMMTKMPGLNNDFSRTELDLTYHSRFKVEIPGAYERLFYDVIQGHQSLFVRKDEVFGAWGIFTPVLHELETKRIKPEPYEFGSRGPQKAIDMIQQLGFIRDEVYNWSSEVDRH
eukprot:TRINITY_DN303_c0_g1_i1.p1 TRINITY_DN303_c0_g1~~TRINITY_DN303_c0_g1_i1.p1  ORF type:complete len:486 (-),score=126.24 TRINITY_DN303_c0_g1_i1:541-1998(-)